MPTPAPSKEVVGPLQYDPKVHRRSLEDPSRSHRRSSIPFADRKPAVRFIRSIESRKRSVAGPYDPKLQGKSGKPILKKSLHPILIDHGDSKRPSEANANSTNDELEICRATSEIVMDKLSSAERIARGSMDVLTFPNTTRRVEALSRYQGCMTVSVCSIVQYTTSEEFKKKQKEGAHSDSMKELLSIIDFAKEMLAEAKQLMTIAKKFYSLSKKRYNEWEELLKRNHEFRVDQCKLKFPLYSNKKMPESVTLYEDALEDVYKNNYGTIEGYVRACRSYPENVISLHCDLLDPNEKPAEPLTFEDSSSQTKVQIIKYAVSHGKDLIRSSSNFLSQGIDVLKDKEIDEGFESVQSRLNSLAFDDCFDPLCALDLKNALGELVARKAELLNTSEQIVEHCKWLRSFTKRLLAFTRHQIKGTNACQVFCCCECRTKQKDLLQSLGIVSVEDVSVIMPLTAEVAQQFFQLDVNRDRNEHGGGEKMDVLK